MKAPVLAVLALVSAPGDANDVVVRQDFSAKTLGSDWKASPEPGSPTCPSGPRSGWSWGAH